MKYTIRSCETAEDFASCAGLQKKVWGYSNYEVYPPRMFLNVPRIGGQVLGAFAPKGQMAGYVVSIPAWNQQCRFYYSLQLGVLPEHENCGLGKMLKTAQLLREGLRRLANGNPISVRGCGRDCFSHKHAIAGFKKSDAEAYFRLDRL